MPNTFANWCERCTRIRDRARDILVSRQEFEANKKSAISRAKVEDDVRYAQLTTRIQSLEGTEAEAEKVQLALETKLHAALYSGIANPSIKVDVVGVVFLSRLSLATIQQSARVNV
jgi:ATP-dependent helicase HepA